MKFQLPKAFGQSADYHLLPLLLRRLPWDLSRVFVSSASGDWLKSSRS